MKKLRHIVVDEGNYNILKQLGRTSESFNDVLTELLKKIQPLEADSQVGPLKQPLEDSESTSGYSNG